jgi:DNA-binding IclR family transcriptional regulator
VLDKSMAILDCVAQGPRSLRELVEATGESRPTVHRLAVALARHGLVGRDAQRRFVLGSRLGEYAGKLPADPLVAASPDVLARLRDSCGESVQLYRRRGDQRVCIAAADREAGLRDTVPVGALLTMKAGSAAQVLLAWEPPEQLDGLLSGARFSRRQLALVRRRGWAASVAEREPGLASVSAPVRLDDTVVLAAVCASGPVERLGRSPGRRLAPAVQAAAEELTVAVGPGPRH